MDLSYFRQREQQERAFAAQSLSEPARAAHLEMAERYRAVIEAHIELDKAQIEAAPLSRATA